MPDRLTASIRRLQIDLDSADNALAMLKQLRAEGADAAERCRWLDALREAKGDAVLLVERGIGNHVGPAAGTTAEQWAMGTLCVLGKAVSLGDWYAAPELDRADFRRENAELSALRRKLAARSRMLAQLPAVLRGSGAAPAGASLSSASPPAGESLPGDERRVLDALKDRKHRQGKAVASRTGYKYNTIRRVLASMRQRGLLGHDGSGYFLP